MKTISENACFGGTQGVYSHASAACACDMTFAVFLPRRGQGRPRARVVVFVGPDLHPRKRDGQGRCASLGRRTRYRADLSPTPPRAAKVLQMTKHMIWAKGLDFMWMQRKNRGPIISECGPMWPMNCPP